MVTKDKVLDYFSLLNRKGILGASYLFVGQDSGLVKDIVKLINCPADDTFCGRCWDCQKIQSDSHPDFFLIEPQPVTIKIERVRESQKFLALKSFRIKRKAVFVKQADTLSGPAASAFLKTLEEPPPNSFIAVCTAKLDGVLPTIVSRCRKIFLPAAAAPEETVLPSSLEDFLRGVNVKFSNRQEFSRFLWTLIILLRDRLVGGLGAPNNRLLKNTGYEIISRSCSREEVGRILEGILNIYSVYHTVNENLALNLIRSQMKS